MSETAGPLGTCLMDYAFPLIIIFDFLILSVSTAEDRKDLSRWPIILTVEHTRVALSYPWTEYQIETLEKFKEIQAKKG
jgi:hypothetical protein